MPTKTIAVYSTVPELEADAKALADKLQLPLLTHPEKDYPYLLVVTPDYIGLQKQASQSLAVYVDFLTKAWQLRLQKLSIKKEALARALGLKKNTHPKIIDATGGLGRDSFIVASLGFEVTLLERSPIIYALMSDGIRRGRRDPETRGAIERLRTVQTDAIIWLNQLKDHDKPDIIYIDPMFPERKKSALPKKEMLIFHDIVGDDDDADSLLYAALTCAAKRVVVKRPRLANSLKASRSPSYSLTGSSCRFDIYLL